MDQFLNCELLNGCYRYISFVNISDKLQKYLSSLYWQSLAEVNAKGLNGVQVGTHDKKCKYKGDAQRPKKQKDFAKVKSTW